MKIKRFAALALAGTMVFSMAACGGEKDGKSSDSQTVSAEASNVSVDTVVEAFDEFTKNQDKNFSADTTMIMKMEAEGLNMNMDLSASSSSYEGVTYSKTTTKIDMLGISQDITEESYTIKKEDGSVVIASKEADAEEWELENTTVEELEEGSSEKLDIEALKKTATMEAKGDTCYVTMKLTADQIDMEENTLMGDMSDFTVDTIVAYNAKESAITSIEFKFDLEALNGMVEELGGGKVSEFFMKIENIKKNDKAIEIPADIKLD